MNKNTNFHVRNLRNTTTHRRNGQSWIDYYIEQSGSRATRCSVVECGGSFEVGAHVTIVDGRTSGSWYIAPFCKGCNHHTNTDIMVLKASTILVPATTL
jgi:hypothetical protein